MRLPSRCYTCGHPIGRYYPAYAAIHQKRFREKLEANKANVAPENILLLDNSYINTVMDDVFTALNIPRTRYCCRMRFITARNFNDARYAGLS